VNFEQMTRNSPVYTFDGCKFDVAERLVFVPSGEPQPLKAKDFQTLLYLVEHPGRVIERDEIMAAVWPDTVVEENNLTQHIAFLRRLLGDSPESHRYIATVPGRGYKFVPQVQALGFADTSETSSAGRIRSIAVLPFKPVSGQTRDLSFEFGMTSDLITKLAGAEGLVVRPLSAIRRFASPEQDAAEAGQELGVDAVIDGNIQISGARVRVSIRLISVAESKQLWADSFDEELTDIFAVQESISERVATSLRVKLSENAKKRYTDDVAAYQLYLEGRFHVVKLNPAEIKQGISYFQRAIELDPNYSLAYAGISYGYGALALNLELPPSDSMQLAVEAAKKAAAIDPYLAEAQTMLALDHYWVKFDWAASEAAFRRALDLDPYSQQAHIYYAHSLSCLGRHREAIAEAAKARKIDPYWALACAFHGLIYHHAEMHDEALARFNEASTLDPSLWLTPLYTAILYTDLQRYEEAIAATRRAAAINGYQTVSNAYECFALAKADRHDEARTILDALLERSGERYVPPYHFAVAYAGLGEHESALFFLEKAYSDPDPKMVFLKAHHFWDDLRSEPQFIELMRKMRFE